MDCVSAGTYEPEPPEEVDTMLPWVSITPLGSPVVPDEYGRCAISSSKLKSKICSGNLAPSSMIILEKERLEPSSELLSGLSRSERMIFMGPKNKAFSVKASYLVDQFL